MSTNVSIFFQANLVKQEGRLKGATAELNAAQKTLDEKQAELNIVQVCELLLSYSVIINLLCILNYSHYTFL